MKIVSKIALAATFGLALTFTLSCSDDDKGGWLTCEEYESFAQKCFSKYEAELYACKGNEACEDAVLDKMDKCFISAAPNACNGTSAEVCFDHYESMGCKMIDIDL